MIVLANYGNGPYRKRQAFCNYAAKRFGRVDRVLSYNETDIVSDREFYLKNESVLREKLGNGLWLWKPYVIGDALKRLRSGDYLIYCDVDIVLIKPVQLLVDTLKRLDRFTLSFEISSTEEQFTKSEAFRVMGCEASRFTKSRQRIAGIQIWKCCDEAIEFHERWLSLCENPELISSKTRHEGSEVDVFVEHKHDMSIYSLLTKKYELEGFRDPSQWGSGSAELDRYINSDYPQICYSGLGDSRKVWLLTRMLGKRYLDRFDFILHPPS
jgi:hypothetical protein